MVCILNWANICPALRPGRCALGGEESQVLFDTCLSSRLPFVCARRDFSEGMVFLSQWIQGRIGHLGTQSRFPGES